MKSYPTKFKSFLWKIVQMGTLQKLQNSIQTLTIVWPVYPIHTNSLFWVIFVELPFCHFPLPNTSIHGKDSKIYRASGRSREKKSNFAGFSGANGRFRGNFAGVFEASFAEKRLVKNGRFRGSFPSKYRWKEIGFALT